MKRAFFIIPSVRHTLVVCGLALSTLLAVSCQKDPVAPAGTDGKNGGVVVGNLLGYVGLITEGGDVLPDASGVTVRLLHPTLTTAPVVTTANGRFEFTNIPTGTYNVEYSRNGFGTIKFVSVKHFGGNVPTSLDKTELSPRSSVTFSNLAVSSRSSSRIVFNSMASSYPVEYYCLVASKDANVSDTHFSGYTISSANSPSDSISLYLSSPNKGLFPSGTTVYVRAYGINLNGDAAYRDLDGNLIFCNTSTTGSNIVPVVIP